MNCGLCLFAFGLLALLPWYCYFVGYNWTKGSLKAIDESTTKKVKMFRATIKKTKPTKKDTNLTKEA